MTYSSPVFLLGLDLGSRRCGMVLAPEALPLVIPIAGHQTLDVDKGDLGPVASQIEAMVASGNVSAVVVEHGPLYLGADWPPAKRVAVAQAHEVASRLHERILTICTGHAIPCHTIARNTWAHRVVPHHQGGVSNDLSNAALPAHVDPEAWGRLADQDQRDAAGVLVGYLLGGAPAGPRPARRRLGPIRDRRKDQSAPNIRSLPLEEQARIRAERKAGEKQRKQDYFRAAGPPGSVERLARTDTDCTCGPGGMPRLLGMGGRHRRGCPVAPAPKRGAGLTP